MTDTNSPATEKPNPSGRYRYLKIATLFFVLGWCGAMVWNHSLAFISAEEFDARVTRAARQPISSATWDVVIIETDDYRVLESGSMFHPRAWLGAKPATRWYVQRKP